VNRLRFAFLLDLVSLAWGSFRRLFGIVWSSPGLRIFIISLLAIDLCWIAFFAVAKGLSNTGINPSLYEHRELRITTDRSIPEWFNYAKTLLVVVLLGRLWRATTERVYFSMMILFSVVLLDDMLEIHELVGKRFVRLFEMRTLLGLRAQDIGEVITWAILGALVVPLLLAGFARSGRLHRGNGMALLLPFGVLLFCAIFVDQLYSNFWDAFPGAGITLDMIEDGGEMLAITTACAIALGALREQQAMGPAGLPSHGAEVL